MRVRRRWQLLAAASGLLVSWLHPWQGLILLGVLTGTLLLGERRDRFSLIVIPALATIAPLAYGVVLSRADPSWAAFQTRTMTSGTRVWWALLASLGPLVLVAALGVRRPRGNGELMLLLWPAVNALVYFVIPEFPPHALSGVTLPLSILAVRGWRRLGLRGAAGAAAAAVAIAAYTLPAAAYHAQQSYLDLSGAAGHETVNSLIELTPHEHAALGVPGEQSAGAGPCWRTRSCRWRCQGSPAARPTTGISCGDQR